MISEVKYLLDRFFHIFLSILWKNKIPTWKHLKNKIYEWFSKRNLINIRLIFRSENLLQTLLVYNIFGFVNYFNIKTYGWPFLMHRRIFSSKDTNDARHSKSETDFCRLIQLEGWKMPRSFYLDPRSDISRKRRFVERFHW